MILPLLAAAFFGAYVGNAFGQSKGFTTALVPLTIDPSLEASYRRVLGPMSPQHEADFNALLRAAREERGPIMQRAGIYQDMPMPQAAMPQRFGPPPPRRPPVRPPPYAAGGGIWNTHGYRPAPTGFYGPHATGGGIWNTHGYRPVPPGFYGPYAAGGGIFTYHGYRPGPSAFYS